VNVTVAEVLAGAEVRMVPLSAECVGYLVLAAADQICAAPRRVQLNDVLLFEDGGIRVANAHAADGSVAERDLRSVLDSLLLCASGPTSGLLRASRRPAGAGVEALVRELETALIPVNRAAAKRALARLERETVRALKSGRIKPATAAPPAPEPSAEAPVVAEAPAGVEAREASAAPPPVVLPREASAVPPAVVALPAPPAVVASPPVPPPTHEPVVAPAAPLAPELAAGDSFEPRDQTMVMARVAPRSEAEPQMVETRPEPVVLRASARPPAAPPASSEPVVAEPVRTEPVPRVAPVGLPDPAVVRSPALPPVAVASASPLAVTPVLGTRVITTTPPAAEVPRSSPVTADDGDVEIVEVLFSRDEFTAIPDDVELIHPEGSDQTEPCPPLALESSMLPPPSVEASELPPWATAPVEDQAVTPPPRVALPKPRPSDVDDLLRRMGDMPLEVDELRSGLKRLAGMEPTPPPPGTTRGD